MSFRIESKFNPCPTGPTLCRQLSEGPAYKRLWVAYRSAGGALSFVGQVPVNFFQALKWFVREPPLGVQLATIGGGALAIWKAPQLILGLMLLGLGGGLWDTGVGYSTFVSGLERGDNRLLRKGADQIREGVGDLLLASLILFFGRGLPLLVRWGRAAPRLERRRAGRFNHLLFRLLSSRGIQLLVRHERKVNVVSKIASFICVIDDPYFIVKGVQRLTR